eukprot:scaffold3205_cov688-Prasinococcus_capsulatus_cf.AAC.3
MGPPYNAARCPRAPTEAVRCASLRPERRASDYLERSTRTAAASDARTSAGGDARLVRCS